MVDHESSCCEAELKRDSAGAADWEDFHRGCCCGDGAGTGEVEVMEVAGGGGAAIGDARAGAEGLKFEDSDVDGSFPSGKLSFARRPRNFVAAMSYAMAASSAVSNVPNHTRAAFFGSRISAAHFPHGLCRTPRYLRFLTGAAPASPVNPPRPPSNCFRPLPLPRI